ncbi:unnamed protein product [Ixodes pacificus]
MTFVSCRKQPVSKTWRCLRHSSMNKAVVHTTRHKSRSRIITGRTNEPNDCFQIVFFCSNKY